MNKPNVHVTFGVNFDGETPYIESTARVIEGELDELPKGKIMVTRTPILPPGASEEDHRKATTTEILDAEHSDDPFHCEECKKLGLSPYAWVDNLQPWPPSRKVGRNEPCPCGSGNKYKKCCGCA
jgi:hypothetical protein